MQAVDERRVTLHLQNPLCSRASKEADFTLETALKWELEWYAENESLSNLPHEA